MSPDLNEQMQLQPFIHSFIHLLMLSFLPVLWTRRRTTPQSELHSSLLRKQLRVCFFFNDLFEVPLSTLESESVTVSPRAPNTVLSNKAKSDPQKHRFWVRQMPPSHRERWVQLSVGSRPTWNAKGPDIVSCGPEPAAAGAAVLLTAALPGEP